MKIIVNPKNYTNFEYHPYLHGGQAVKAPTNPNYVVGQVVVVERTDELGKGKFEMAVVLGCIDEEFDGELRLDLCGMTSIDKIRPAVVTDFGKSNVRCHEAIYKECQGYKVTRNEDYSYIFEEPKF